MMNGIDTHSADRNTQTFAHANENNDYRTKGAKRIGGFTRFLLIVGLLAFLFGLAEVLVSGAQLRSAGYKDAVRLHREYSDLHDKYQMIYLDIAERQAEVEAEDKRTRDYWRKERTQDEARWNKQWEGFDSLVAYYSQSAEKYEMLMKRTDEYARTDSKYSDLVRNIANEAEERSYVGNVFMGIGGALFALGIMKLLRDLQLLGRFSRLTKYCTF